MTNTLFQSKGLPLLVNILGYHVWRPEHVFKITDLKALCDVSACKRPLHGTL